MAAVDPRFAQERLNKHREKLRAEGPPAPATIWLDEPVWSGGVKIVGVSSEKQREEVMAWAA
jgi:hypothetical protein